MTKLLLEKVLHQGDLIGIADMCGDHAQALDDVAKRAGLLAGPARDAQIAMAEAKEKLEILAKIIDEHTKDAKVVAL